MCRGNEIRKRKTRLSWFEFTFVREAEIVLFVLCMCAVGGVVLQYIYICSDNLIRNQEKSENIFIRPLQTLEI